MRDRIRKWIKKIIKETLIENFPSCNITITDSDKSDIKLILKGGTFINSSIKMDKEFMKKSIHVEECYVQQDEGPFIQ